MRKKRLDYVDDGRVIAPMNVDGMPWYEPVNTPNDDYLSGKMQDGESSSAISSVPFPVKLTREENRAFASGVLKAVLLVSFVFIGTLFLFILFCIHVWFR